MHLPEVDLGLIKLIYMSKNNQVFALSASLDAKVQKHDDFTPKSQHIRTLHTALLN